MNGDDDRKLFGVQVLVFPVHLRLRLNTGCCGRGLANEPNIGQSGEDRHAVLLGRHPNVTESREGSRRLGSLLDNVANARFLQKRECVSTSNISHSVTPFRVS